MAKSRLSLLIVSLVLCASAMWAQEPLRLQTEGAPKKESPGRLEQQAVPVVRGTAAWRSMTKSDCGSTDVCCHDTLTSGTCCAWLFGQFLGCWRDY